MECNKCILITGASSEVGLQFLQKEGPGYEKILAHYCHPSEGLMKLKETMGERIRLFRADFSSEEGALSLADAAAGGGLLPDHILLLPSAKYRNRKFWRMGWEDFQLHLSIQLRSAVTLLQRLLPGMEKRHSGRVVFLLSSCTEGPAPKYLSDYVTVKYALLGLMRSLASEYAGRGITFNAVSPGMMETKLLEQVPELVIRQNAMENPCGRNVRVEEILPAVSMFLNGSEMITGQNLIIRGGR